MEDMARRSARFHLTLGDITRSTETSPEMFLRYKHALLAHMGDFMAELDRYLPRLTVAVIQVEATGLATLLNRAAEADERPLMRYEDVLDDWRRRWAAVRAWFTADGAGIAGRRTGRGHPGRGVQRDRAAPPDHRGPARRGQPGHPAAPPGRPGCSTPPTRTPRTRSWGRRSACGRARHLGGVHDDSDLISAAAVLVRRARGGDLGHAVPAGQGPDAGGAAAGCRPATGSGPTCGAARRRGARPSRRPPGSCLAPGWGTGCSTRRQTRVLLTLLTRALEARTVVAGRITGGAGGNDVMVMRLVPSPDGSAVRTAHGVLHLPGLRLELAAARPPGAAAGGLDRDDGRADRRRGVAPSDLGSYQHAVRLVLTHDLITASRPRAGALATVLRWADLMARDLAALLGYTLIATAHQVRLVRRLDTVDDTQRSVFAARSGRPFDRRRLAYLCLVLAVFQRSRIEISLADLVRAFTPTANAIDGLGFDATITEHKAAVVDVLDWLADRGALRLSDGSAETWARDTDRGDALYDIDHDICAALFRPARPCST